LFKNIDLPGSGRRIYIPASPETVIVEIILSGAGLKDSVTGNGPGKFVFEGGHCRLLFKGLFLCKNLMICIGQFTDIITRNQYILRALYL
jgi:hypothetical protein